MAAKKPPAELQTTFATYRIMKIIGQGGAGKVYEGLDPDEQPCAIKVLEPTGAMTEKRQRFKNEIAFCQRYSHPNIVRVLDHGLTKVGEEFTPFYVMPLYSTSLRDLLKSGIRPDRVLKYHSNMLDAVEAAHLYNVVHRDIKPENFLFDAGRDSLLLGDFGIARFCQEELYTLVETKPTSRLANFHYAAPEQRTRGLKVGPPADIFALGLILNEMYTGIIPVGTDYKTIQSNQPDLAYLDDLVVQMIRQQPSERPQSIESVKQMLIGKRNEFIGRQRLSELNKEVVPTTDLDDALILDPPRIVRFDWQRGRLTLILNRPTNPRFVWALNNMGGYESLWGKGPGTFELRDNTAAVDARENEVQAIIDHFKRWLPNAMDAYKRSLKLERDRNEAREREEIVQEVEELERRERLRNTIKI